MSFTVVDSVVIVVVVMVFWVWRCDDGDEKGEEDGEEQGWAAHVVGCAGSL